MHFGPKHNQPYIQMDKKAPSTPSLSTPCLTPTTISLPHIVSLTMSNFLSPTPISPAAHHVDALCSRQMCTGVAPAPYAARTSPLPSPMDLGRRRLLLVAPPVVVEVR